MAPLRQVKKRRERLRLNRKAIARAKAGNVVYYEVIPRNVTVTAEVYCQQLRGQRMILPYDNILPTSEKRLFMNSVGRLSHIHVPLNFRFKI